MADLPVLAARRRAALSGYPLCRWDEVCPVLGTHVGLCGPHWGAWRRGVRPVVGQLTFDVEVSA